jgi:hypothetical protein
MKIVLIALLELLIFTALKGQNITERKYGNDRFHTFENGLSSLQRHCFSKNGDTLVVINHDSLFVFNVMKRTEVQTLKLPFTLDADLKLGGIVDFYESKIVVLQVYFSEPSCYIKYVVFDETLKQIETSKINCNEWIFLTGFAGRIKLKNKELRLQDYGRNKEELFIDKCSGEYSYIEHDRKSIYHNITEFEDKDTQSLVFTGKVLDNGLVVKNVISFYKSNVAFCENKDKECALVLLGGAEHTLLDITYSNYDCSAVKLFDSGFSWFKDGCFYNVVLPSNNGDF